MLQQNKRNVNIDIIRIIAFVFILFTHSIGFTGYLEEDLSQVSLVPMFFMSTLFRCCIALFIMITGFLGWNKTQESSIINKHTYKSLKRILLEYFFSYILLTVCFLYIPYNYDTSVTSGLYYKQFDFLTIFIGLIKFKGYYSWYIKMYLSLALLQPFFQILWRNLNENNKKALFIIGFILYIFPATFYNRFIFIANILPFYLTHSFFGIIYCYFIGLQLAELYYNGEKFNRSKLLLGTFIPPLIAAVLWHITASEGADIPSFSDNFSLLLVISSTSIFALVLSIDTSSLSQKKINALEKIADSTLAAYLISPIFDYLFCYNLLQPLFPTITLRYIEIPIQVILSFICSILLGYVINHYSAILLKRKY